MQFFYTVHLCVGQPKTVFKRLEKSFWLVEGTTVAKGFCRQNTSMQDIRQEKIKLCEDRNMTTEWICQIYNAVLVIN